MRAGVPGGVQASKPNREDLADVFSPSEFDGGIEAAFLLKSTGIALAAWTKTPVPQEVISVMAATMWGSLDTMIRTLGSEGPRSALLEIESRRILIMQVEPSWTLLLIAPRSVGTRRLRHEAQRVLERLSHVRRTAVPKRAPVAVRE